MLPVFVSNPRPQPSFADRIKVLPEFQTGQLSEPDGAVKPYVTIGTGPLPMVVVPGAADGLVTCVDVALYLAWFYRHRAQTCRLLILSRREPIPERFGIEQHADDMIRTVEELRFGPAVWECISAAGPIGQWVAVKRPDLVPGLILSSTYDYADDRTRQVFQQWLTLAEQAGGDLLWSMIEPKYRPPEGVLSQVEPALRPSASRLRDAGRLKRILLELLDLDQRDLVSQIASATLVIGGADDRVVPAEAQRQMAARIPGSCLELCAGYGHFNDMENPAYQQFVECHLQGVYPTVNWAKGSSPD